MPNFVALLSPGTGRSVSEMQNVAALHVTLRSLGFAPPEAETIERHFGPGTVSAVRDVRERFGLPAADSVDAATSAFITLATTAASGNKAELRAVLAAAQPLTSDVPPKARAHLARFAILAGDYVLAKEIAFALPAGITSDVPPVFVLPTPYPLAPEVPHPENFYSYRHDLYALQTLNDLQHMIGSLSEPPRETEQALDGRRQDGGLLIRLANSWLEAIKQWQVGNTESLAQHFDGAKLAYDACQESALDYFKGYYGLSISQGPLQERVAQLLGLIVGDSSGSFSPLLRNLQWRQSLLSLAELSSNDWGTPAQILWPRQFDPVRVVAANSPAPVPFSLPDGRWDFGLGFIQRFLQESDIPQDSQTNIRQGGLEIPLATIAFVLVPLARGETYRMRRFYQAAITEFRTISDPIRPFVCHFIERPFARLLEAETLLDQAESQYKSRQPLELVDEPVVLTAGQDFSTRFSLSGTVRAFPLLQAVRTYLRIFEVLEDEGAYAARVRTGAEELHKTVSEAASFTSKAFRNVVSGLKNNIFQPIASTSRKSAPHQALVEFVVPGSQAMRETNPRVYAVLLQAQSRLLQLWSGFNYLGYTDDYTPPWRFQFLLERARYFAEHAKNAQRDYLNFLGNAEHEAFQELSASQAVEMEKSNVTIEGARVSQVTAEVTASSASKDLADLSRDDAQRRVAAFEEFDLHMRSLESDSAIWGVVGAFAGVALTVATGGAAAPFVIGAGVGMLSSIQQEQSSDWRADSQRNLELNNLALAETEALQASTVAAANLDVAKAGLLVAGLQHQAALLRHENALQTLLFLRSQTLNTEQWYRLAASIRSIADTYLRYAIELGFLTEQAYEFEADKQINVMRFDYDQSEVGNYLAADFLLRDLDTLEQNLLVSLRQRQQQVKYTLSMARDFPAALQELRDKGSVSFALPLEQIERRFPGLFNARLGAVDVMPVALLDATRFSLELTHLGSGVVRRRAQPGDAIDVAPANSTPEQIELATEWKRLIRVDNPETTIFSGLSRQEAGAVFPFMTNGQRNAFEGRPAACAWKIDMSMKDNQVVPGTLADLLITFTVSGYQDGRLRRLVEATSPRLNVVTSYLSARQLFPDAFYDFNRTGRMAWKVTPDRLALIGDAGRLRNIGVVLVPAADRFNFGRMHSRYAVDLRIHNDGTLEILSEIPKVSFTVAAQNTLSVSASVAGGADISWDFGDGGGFLIGAEINGHVYAKPGFYVVTLRIVRGGRLSEYRADVSVSRTHVLTGPATEFPQLSAIGGAATGKTRLRAQTAANTAIWTISNQGTQRGQQADFDLAPGKYSLNFVTQRALSARMFCNQRLLPQQNSFVMTAATLTTNRKFDEAGADVTGGNANQLTQHLFTNPTGEISPADLWTLDLPEAQNPFLSVSTGADVIAPSFASLQDVLLVVESEVLVV
jgi:hypothetical protein